MFIDENKNNVEILKKTVPASNEAFSEENYMIFYENFKKEFFY